MQQLRLLACPFPLFLMFFTVFYLLRFALLFINNAMAMMASTATNTLIIIFLPFFFFSRSSFLRCVSACYP